MDSESEDEDDRVKGELVKSWTFFFFSVTNCREAKITIVVLQIMRTICQAMEK